MAYKIHKLVDDNRNHTCGYLIPNGGFYYVVELTFENYQQLKNLSQAPGYSVDYVDGPLGFYDPEGYEIVPDTIEIDKVSKMVTGYQRRTKKSRGKMVEVKAKHESHEREEAIKRARELGYNVSNLASTLMIKEVADKGKRVGQSTLSATLS